MKTLIQKSTLIVAVGIGSMLATGYTSAAENSWYVGGSVTQAYVDESGVDDDDTGGKIFGGYRFNQYLSVEAEYYDFGDLSEGANELSLDGLGVAVVGSVPIHKKFSAFGKIGVHDWDAKGTPLASLGLKDDSGTDAYYGVGVEYRLSNPWRLRGEVVRYDVDDIDVDVASFGLSFHF